MKEQQRIERYLLLFFKKKKEKLSDLESESCFTRTRKINRSNKTSVVFWDQDSCFAFRRTCCLPSIFERLQYHQCSHNFKSSDTSCLNSYLSKCHHVWFKFKIFRKIFFFFFSDSLLLTLVSSVKPLPFAPKWPTWRSRSDLGRVRVRVERDCLRGSWRSDSKWLAFAAVRESENRTSRNSTTIFLHK